MKETYLNSRPVFKSCKNCAYRYRDCGIDHCGLSGLMCESERHFGRRCGENFERWLPKPKRRSLRQWLFDLLLA